MEHDDVLARLSSFGRHPVEPAVAARHAAALSSVPAAAPGRRRPLMAGALLAGALVAGTGLAAAVPGSLPERAGSVARAALEVVNLADDGSGSRPARPAAADGDRARPPGDAAADAAGEERSQGAVDGDPAAAGPGVARFVQGCTTGTPPSAFTGNHGAYVRSRPDDPATADVDERHVAARSDCGKPLPAVTAGGKGAREEDGRREAGPAATAPGQAGEPRSPERPGAAPERGARGRGEVHPPADGEQGRSRRAHPR